MSYILYEKNVLVVLRMFVTRFAKYIMIAYSRIDIIFLNTIRMQNDINVVIFFTTNLDVRKFVIFELYTKITFQSNNPLKMLLLTRNDFIIIKLKRELHYSKVF